MGNFNFGDLNLEISGTIDKLSTPPSDNVVTINFNTNRHYKTILTIVSFAQISTVTQVMFWLGVIDSSTTVSTQYNTIEKHLVIVVCWWKGLSLDYYLLPPIDNLVKNYHLICNKSHYRLIQNLSKSYYRKFDSWGDDLLLGRGHITKGEGHSLRKIKTIYGLPAAKWCNNVVGINCFVVVCLQMGLAAPAQAQTSSAGLQSQSERSFGARGVENLWTVRLGVHFQGELAEQSCLKQIKKRLIHC
jgi:hypothetical protein